MASAFKLRNLIKKENVKLKCCDLFICPTPCFWMNLCAHVIPSFPVPVPPEFIYFTQKLICPALMPALNLTFFVAGPWKETKLLKLVRVRESSLLKYCLSLSFSLYFSLCLFPEKKC